MNSPRRDPAACLQLLFGNGFRHRSLLLFPALVGLAATVPSCSDEPPELRCEPVVQMVTTDGFSLVLQPDASQKIQGELFDPEGRSLGQATLTRSTGRRIALTFDDLDPDRPYRYVVGDGDEVIVSGTVRTAPDRPREFRVLVFGDSGTGGSDQYRLAARMPAFNPDLILHTGDLVYPEGELRHYHRKFYLPYAPLLRRVPFYPVIGNHDYKSDAGEPMLEYFILPRNGPETETRERHYYFDYAGVRFVAIDTDLSGDALEDEIAPWLDDALSNHDGEWKVVFLHHPIYTNAFHPPAHRVRSAIRPVLEEHGVDVVFQGHNHLYERSHPLLNDEVMPGGEGVTYVTTGAGGGELYPAKGTPSPLIAQQYDDKHSFTIIDVGSDSMLLRQIDIDGTVVDEYDIVEFSTSRPPTISQ